MTAARRQFLLCQVLCSEDLTSQDDDLAITNGDSTNQMKTLRRKQSQPQSLKRLQNQKRSASAAGGGQNLWWYPIDTLTLDIQTYWCWYWTNEHLLSVRNIHGRWPAVEMKLAHMKVPQCFNDEMCVSVFMFPLVLWVSEWNADHMFIAVRFFFQVEIGWRKPPRSRSHLHSLQQACWLEKCWDGLLFPLSSFQKDNHNENNAIGKLWKKR